MNQFDRTGFILYVFRYEESVAFYRDTLQLPLLFTTPTLSCFKFGESYLMVEIDDESDPEIKYQERTRTCLRLNVKDVKPLADRLSLRGIEVDYQEHDWGTVAKFRDPDGNLCAFKDSFTFEKQVESGS